MSRFKDAIDLVLSQEGGYVNDPDDPGGETNWGISKRAFPALDIAALTRDDAVKIYKAHYWEPNKIALIHCQSIANKNFSFVVNMGARPAGRILQRALRANGVEVKIDGAVGPATRRAINEFSGYQHQVSTGWSDGSVSTSLSAWKPDPGSRDALLAAIRSEAAGHYRLLIEKNPRLERFRNGWMNRAYE